MRIRIHSDPYLCFSRIGISISSQRVKRSLDFFPVWRIRDVYSGSRIRLFSIPDPRSSSKNSSILTPKKAKKWFLSSKKYDLGCSSRIPGPGSGHSPIPDPGSWGQKGTQSRIPDPDPQHCLFLYTESGSFLICKKSTGSRSTTLLYKK